MSVYLNPVPQSGGINSTQLKKPYRNKAAEEKIIRIQSVIRGKQARDHTIFPNQLSGLAIYLKRTIYSSDQRIKKLILSLCQALSTCESKKIVRYFFGKKISIRKNKNYQLGCWSLSSISGKGFILPLPISLGEGNYKKVYLGIKGWIDFGAKKHSFQFGKVAFVVIKKEQYLSIEHTFLAHYQLHQVIANITDPLTLLGSVINPKKKYYEYSQTLYLCDLNHALKNKMDISFQDRFSVVYQLIRILKNLHKKKAVHCDVKPANLFVTMDRDRKIQIKLGDFDFVSNANEYQWRELKSRYMYHNVWAAGKGCDIYGLIMTIGQIFSYHKGKYFWPQSANNFISLLEGGEAWYSSYSRAIAL